MHEQVFITLGDAYISRALELVGLVPVTPATSTADDVYCGVVIPGGADVHPKWYGQEIDGAKPFEQWRDKSELDIAQRAIKLEIPLLGICRGHQLINVASGGTLIQDLGKRGEEHSGQHPITAISKHKGVILDALRREPSNRLVNSYHHQAIHRLGQGLRVTSVSDDGVIESIEGTNEGFVLGVQFHPEMEVGYSGGNYKSRAWEEWTNDDWDRAARDWTQKKSALEGALVPVRHSWDDPRYVAIFERFAEACKYGTPWYFGEKE